MNIFSLDGQLKSSTGRKGNGAAGELNGPRICVTDAAGATLIADTSNDRLQLLSANEQWSTMNLQPSVKWPYGACVLNDMLFVNDLNEKSIHAYKTE